MNEYDDREMWSNTQLLGALARCVSGINKDLGTETDYLGKLGEVRAAILARMSAAPQDDEWEERELHNEIMRDGDIYGGNQEKSLLIPYWFGHNSDEINWTPVYRRVRKQKPQPAKSDNFICPECGAEMNVREVKTQAPQVKFAIAGTKDAELPGVVVLELVQYGNYSNDLCLHCKNRDLGWLLSIDKYTGKVKREEGIRESIGFPIDNLGRLVIE
jgi:hypothetical protein